ncbi:MAG: hypothetical protein K1X83_14775 [Oligoflexia bacterium]|nr:hypothetical protein [Oligoflexia bacterium]
MSLTFCNPEIGRKLPEALPHTPECEQASARLLEAAKSCPRGWLDLELLAGLMDCDLQSVTHGLMSLHERGLVELSFEWSCSNSPHPNSAPIISTTDLNSMPLETDCPHCRQHHLLRSADILIKFALRSEAPMAATDSEE